MSRRRLAFSLLELMVVLVVMVGVLAIVWPNLQRPFRKAGLSEATQKLRQAIDDGRYQAMTTGTPVFIQIRQGGHEVRSVGLDSMVVDDFGDLRPSGSSEGEPTRAAMIPPQTLLQQGTMDEPLHAVTPRVWKLPEHVVISSVQWELSSNVDSDEQPAMTDAENNQEVRSAGSSREAYGNSQRTATADAGSIANQEPESPGDDAEEQWYLPLTAMGHGRDAEITLWDTKAHESMRVSFTASTGALEIIR